MKSCEVLLERLKAETVIETRAVELTRIPYPDKVFRGFQGGCSDGERYYYQVLMHYELSDRTKDFSCIAKVDLETMQTVKYSSVLHIDHANDITYHKGLHTLIVTHNKPNPKRISFVDPDTLEITETREIEDAIYALEYNEAKNCYVAGLSGTREFRFLDADFRPLDSVTHRTDERSDRCVKQGICADDHLLYFILWDGRYKTEPDFQNRVTLYDYTGAYRGVLHFDIGPHEPENISIVNGEIIAVCVGEGSYEPVLYRLDIIPHTP